MFFPDPAISSLQCTLNEITQLEGPGAQNCSTVSVKLVPAPANSGIRFIRSDVDSRQNKIPANWKNVADTGHGLLLANEFGTSVAGGGHLLAALRNAGVDNLSVELDGNRVPAVDGSAAPWVRLIAAAGIARQHRTRFGIWIERPVEVRQGERYAMLTPSTMPRVTVSVDHFDEADTRKCLSLPLTSEIFAQQIAPARSSCSANSILKSRLPGEIACRHNDPELCDGCLHHKLLECCAGLALTGLPIFGHLFAYQPGHHLVVGLLRALFANGYAWRCLAFEEINRRVRGACWAGKTQAEAEPSRMPDD